jgi:hypothetical protein
MKVKICHDLKNPKWWLKMKMAAKVRFVTETSTETLPIEQTMNYFWMRVKEIKDANSDTQDGGKNLKNIFWCQMKWPVFNGFKKKYFCRTSIHKAVKLNKKK